MKGQEISFKIKCVSGDGKFSSSYSKLSGGTWHGRPEECINSATRLHNPYFQTVYFISSYSYLTLIVLETLPVHKQKCHLTSIKINLSIV